MDADLIQTFRAYQRTGSYAEAAIQLDLTVPQVKRRLMRLYDELDIPRHAGGNRAIVASYHLRALPY